MKDFEENPFNYTYNLALSHVRAEAIKWVKRWKKQRFTVQDAEIYMMKGAKIKWAIHFFNITDEELK